MGPNINFAIAYAIGCLIVEVIVILRYEKKIDKLRESNRRLILDNISYRAVLSVTPNTIYNKEETLPDYILDQLIILCPADIRLMFCIF